MKRLFLYAVAFLATSAGFVSCAEDEVNPAAEVTVAEEEMEVAAAGGAFALNLTAPTGAAYSVELPEWITVLAPRANTNTTESLTFAVAHQTSCEERVGEIRFVCGGLTDVVVVKQAGIELAASEESVTVPTNGGVVKFNLTAAPAYKVEMPEWIVMNESADTTHLKGITAGISFTVAQNTTGAERNDSIVFTCCENCQDTVKVYVTQQGLDLAKMVSYSGKETSLAYGDVYENHTIGLIWSEADATQVFVCNVEPYYYSKGAKVENGMNFVQAVYDAASNMIIVQAGSPLNIVVNSEEGPISMLTAGGGEEQGMLTHVFYSLNEDKTTITRTNDMYTIFYDASNNLKAEDLYAAGATFTLVEE